MYDITRWLDHKLGPYRYTSNDTEMNMCCPFCGDTDNHLYVAVNNPVWNCRGCGEKGTYLGLVIRVEHCGVSDALDAISSPKSSISQWDSFYETFKAGTKSEVKNGKLPPTYMPEWFVTFASSCCSLYSKLLLHYALSRVTPEIVRDYNFGYCIDDTLPYFGRLIIPVEGPYFQARSVFGTPKGKYINPSMHIGDRLFNAGALKRYKHIGICEGSFSAFAFGCNSVATLGNKLTPGQLYRIANSGVRYATISFDAGTAYSQPVLDAAKYLYGCGISVNIRDYKDGDPDSSNDYNEKIYDQFYTVRRLNGSTS